jgi:hypothetical protein
LHPEDFFHDSSPGGHEIHDAAHVHPPLNNIPINPCSFILEDGSWKFNDKMSPIPLPNERFPFKEAGEEGGNKGFGMDPT